MGFIEEIAPLIQKYAPKYDIKVCSPIVAQAVLESGSGNSELAKNANNYFGLKYKKGRCPTACGYYTKVGSEQNKDGSYTSSVMQWMKFKDMEDGVQGYFDFINNSNYANLKGVTDPKTYLENIKADGYATSVSYSSNLMNVINRYNLTKYDSKIQTEVKHMGYSNSPLATYTQISPNKTISRKHALDTLTVHCFVGQVTAKRGCEVFQPTTRKASCNYVVGHDGSIGLCVEEKDMSWCSSNGGNDDRAITFEVASDNKHPYSVTDTALNALIDLITDICKRNGKTKVLWFADKAKTLAYNPKDNEMVMTVHRWFANKSCPGDYLYNKHGYIADEVNKRLSSVSAVAPSSSSEPTQYTALTDFSKFIFENINYSPVFNPDYYVEKYQDLKNAFGNNPPVLFMHFCVCGMKEGRVACEGFDVHKYRSYYSDLRDAFGDDLQAYYKHYITNGQAEGRECI